MLKEQGFDVEVVAFERHYHKGRLPDCPITLIGKIDHGEYLKRLIVMIRAVPILRQRMKANSVIYLTGLDMAFFSMGAGIGFNRAKIIEVGDIRDIQLRSGIMGKLIRWLDGKVVDRCRLIVVTAPDFLNSYYHHWVKTRTPGLVIENKLEQAVVSNFRQSINASTNIRNSNGRLVIGYFGLLRCQWSWDVLKYLATHHSERFEIVVAGFSLGLNDVAEFANSQPNVNYLGEFKSPQDLPDLYSKVDIVWSCYKPIEPDDWNLKWARPNRFYESCCFGKPMVSRDGSKDALVVSQHNIGVVVAETNVVDAAKRISAISDEQYAEWQQNLLNIPQSLYTYTTESADLAKAIRGMLRD